MIKKIWIIILIYVLFIYISLPYFPVFIACLKNYIAKDTLNILSVLFCISFFLVLSKWIYDKQYKFVQYIFIISPLILLTYMSFSLDVWAERVHFIHTGYWVCLFPGHIKSVLLKYFWLLVYLL